jgi:hypothetical protein
MTADERTQMANVMTSILEMTTETLTVGAIPYEIRGILQETANRIDIIGRNVRAYNAEKDAGKS